LHSKTHDVSSLMGRGCSWNRILLEIEKCEVVFSNCHRRRTAMAQNWYSHRVWTAHLANVSATTVPRIILVSADQHC
jgi:hypothetical protein